MLWEADGLVELAVEHRAVVRAGDCVQDERRVVGREPALAGRCRHEREHAALSVRRAVSLHVEDVPFSHV